MSHMNSNDTKTKPRTVKLVKSSYQPNKADLEEDFRLDVPGDSTLEKFKKLTRSMVQPVNVRWIPKPHKRR